MQSPQRHISKALLLLVLGLFVAEAWEPRPQIDDAFISYRYARNLAEGNGLVFNIGQYVEGYTNLLWTLLIALGIRLGFAATTLGHVFGLLSGLAALYATYVYAATGLGSDRKWIAGLAPAALLATTGFGYWAMSGLETALFLAAISFALAAEARDRLGLATLAACVATLTRPDGGLVACVIFAAHIARHHRSGIAIFKWPAVYGAFLLALTAGRLLYYGDPLPNTFYAKIGGVPWHYGKIYIQMFLADGSMWLLLPALFVFAASSRLWPGFVYMSLVFLYVFRIGGDAFPHYRFLLPALIPLIVCAIRGAEASYDRYRVLGVALAMGVPLSIAASLFGPVPPALILALAIAALGCSASLLLGDARLARYGGWTAGVIALAFAFSLALPQEDGSRFDTIKRSRALATQASNNRYSEAHGLRRARAFTREEPPPGLIATSSIGALGFYSRLELLDIVGIVDREIARSEPDVVEGVFLIPGHQRSNVAHVLSRRPDYIVTPKPWTGLYIAAFAAIWNHPEVARDYVWIDELSAYRRRPDAP